MAYRGSNGSRDRSSAARDNERFGPGVMRSRPVNSLQALRDPFPAYRRENIFFKEGRKEVWRGVGLQDKTPSFAWYAGAVGVSLPSNYGPV